MTTQPSPSLEMVSILAEKAIKNGQGDEIKTHAAFTAAEIGLTLGWQVMKEADPEKRQWETWRLGRNLGYFNDSPYCNTRIWDAVRSLRIITPENLDSGYAGNMLAEHSTTTIKEAAAQVLEDTAFADVLDRRAVRDQRQRLIDRISSKQREDLRAIRDETIRQTTERQGIPVEGEQTPVVSKERETI